MAQTIYDADDIWRLMEAFVVAWERGVLFDNEKNEQLYHKIRSHRIESGNYVEYTDFTVKGNK